MKSLLVFAATAAALVVERQAASPELPGAAPISRLEAQQPIDGGKRARISLGHFNLPANGMTSTVAVVQPPCTNCYVTAAQANLLYEDGSEANVDTGAWLHHIVVTGIPEPGVMWASGNERPTIRLNTKYKYGWHFPSAVMYSSMIDLMSNAPDNKKVELVIDFEFIPQAQAQNYKSVYMEWIDMGFPAAQKGKVTFNSWRNWTSTIDGQLLYAIGHMHDGGTDVTLYQNNKAVCKSLMLYNNRAHYTVPLANSTMGNMQGMMGDTSEGVEWHISDPGTCANFGPLKKGDVLRTEIHYDFDKYGTMEHNGEEEALMGNMRVYIGPN